MFLLSLCVVVSGRILLTPQVCFVACFLPQAVFAIFFVEQWGIEFCTETVLILFSGTGLFFILSLLFQSFRAKYKISLYRRNSLTIQSQEKKYFQSDREIKIEAWKLYVLLAVQVGSLFLTVYYLMTNVAGANILMKIAAVNNANKFGDANDFIIMPQWVSWPKEFCRYSSYLTGYLLFHSIIFKYKQHKVLLVANILMSMIIILTSGGRMGVVSFIVAQVIMIYFFWGIANHWRVRVKIKLIIEIVVVGVLVLAIFQQLSFWVGRGSEREIDFIHYLGVYIAAPLKNLDTFIREGNYGNPVSNWQTLYALVNFIGRHFNMQSWIHPLDLPYRRIRGSGTGNVYTAFYSYLHDGGYVAFVIFISLQVFIAQWVFFRVIYAKSKHRINLSIVIYSYILQSICFSFFSERFYQDVVNFTFVKMLISWWLLVFFFENVKVKKESIRHGD